MVLCCCSRVFRDLVLMVWFWLADLVVWVYADFWCWWHVRILVWVVGLLYLLLVWDLVFDADSVVMYPGF